MRRIKPHHLVGEVGLRHFHATMPVYQSYVENQTKSNAEGTKLLEGNILFLMDRINIFKPLRGFFFTKATEPASNQQHFRIAVVWRIGAIRTHISLRKYSGNQSIYNEYLVYV